MARRKRTQFTGTLAQPIDDIKLIMPLDKAREDFEKWVEESTDRLHTIRIQKMPELARQLGMQVEKFDLTTHTGLMGFYGQLALNLAIASGIPGFQTVRSKWPREWIKAALQDGDSRRLRGEPSPDLTACLLIVRLLDPDLRRSSRKSTAIRRAKTLRNQVSKLRQRLGREAAAEAKRNAAPSVRLLHDGGDRLH
jgi:hypothetical protein